MKSKIAKSLLIILTLLSIAFFFRMLDADKEFSGDQARTVSMARLKFTQIIPTLKEEGIYPPLTYILCHYWMKLDQSNLWIRGYFILFGLGTCFLIYLISREYINEKFARIALSLAVFSPLLIFASQYARSYIDSAFWMLLSSLFMLKILKGKKGMANWVGYIFSSALSLYTFYFSALLILAQFIFITVFKRKERACLLKWYLAFFIVCLIFGPWLPSAASQFHNASSISYDWSGKGFNLGALRIGLYTRNIFSIIGFDPYAMVFKGGITSHFPGSILILSIATFFGLFTFFLYYCFKYLRAKFHGHKELVWFFPFLIFIPLITTWVCAYFLNILPNAKYFVAFHAFFLILIATFIYNLLKKNRIVGYIVLVSILIIFTLRIPQVVSPEFDTKGALQFLEIKLSKKDCIIYIRSFPGCKNAINTIDAGMYFKLNNEKSNFIFASNNSQKELMKKITPFKRVWFYGVGGNVEVFGANRLLDNWLKKHGYEKITTVSFKNIDVVKYEKK